MGNKKKKLFHLLNAKKKSYTQSWNIDVHNCIEQLMTLLNTSMIADTSESKNETKNPADFQHVAEMMESGNYKASPINTAKTKEAIKIIQAAVQQDEQKNPAKAIELYENGVKLFKEVMTYETNAQYKFSLAKKMDKYMKATNKKSKKKFYQSRARSLLQEENPESTLSKPKRPKRKSREYLPGMETVQKN